MSERWVKRSERVLKRLKDFETEDMDRLDLVRSLRFFLGSLWGSLSGWMQWINNPDIMTRYSKEELEVMSNEMKDFVKSFIEYDIKMTKEGLQKGVKERGEGRIPTSRDRVIRETPDRLVI